MCGEVCYTHSERVVIKKKKRVVSWVFVNQTRNFIAFLCHSSVKIMNFGGNLHEVVVSIAKPTSTHLNFSLHTHFAVIN